MKVFIKILQGDGCTVEITEDSTVLDVKKQIQNDLKIPIPQQSLLLLGKALVDEKPISFYPNIKDGTKLNLVVKKPEALQVVLIRFLQKFYDENQSKRICDEFMKVFFLY